MATNSTDTYDQVGIREDLSDIIYNVDPYETPFFSNCARMDAESTKFEWQTDELRAPRSDTAVEGEEATFQPKDPTVRLDNQTEIVKDTVMISDTTEATNRAGREKEMAYQKVKVGKELRTDIEHHCVGIHNAKVVGSKSVARETASYASWCGTNVSVGGGVGAVPAALDGTAVPTAGTDRDFTEALLGEVIDSCWNNGGDPDIIMCGSAQKRRLNTFAGNTLTGATAGNIQRMSDEKRIINAVDVYESDYGVMAVVPNRFVKQDDVLVYQKDMWKIAVLRPMQSKPLAKTGDNEKEQMLMEWGLCAANEKSSGAIYDLNV